MVFKVQSFPIKPGFKEEDETAPRIFLGRELTAGRQGRKGFLFTDYTDYALSLRTLALPLVRGLP
jgi:hypothetical protein